MKNKTDKPRQQGTPQQKHQTDTRANTETLKTNRDVPGHSRDEAYMKHTLDWPTGGDSSPWTFAVPEDGKEDSDLHYDKRNDKIKVSNKYVSKIDNSKVGYNTSKINYDRNDNTDRYANIITNTNVEVNKEDDHVSIREPIETNRKHIKIIDNIQLVPPTHPSPSYNKWTKIERRGNRSRTVNTEAYSPRQRQKDIKNPSGAKSGKRLVKPAVVTVTSKSGGVTYAEILARAREKVSLKELGIQTTVIRRAIMELL